MKRGTKLRITKAAPGFSPLSLVGLMGALLATVPNAQAQTSARPASPPAAALSSPAQPATGPFTLQGAVDYASAHNLTVRQNVLNYQNNQQILLQSKAALLPSVNLNGTQTWNFGTNVNPFTFEFQSQTIR